VKIDAVYFREGVRVHGNVFLRGVSLPDDQKHWEVRAEPADRVVLLKGKNDTRFHGVTFVVPFENVSCMRLAPENRAEVMAGVVVDFAQRGLIQAEDAAKILKKKTG
jgi:hypothetical protein